MIKILIQRIVITKVRILHSPLGLKTSKIIILIAIMSIYFSTRHLRACDNVYNVTNGKETEICEYSDFSPFTFTFN